MNRAVRVMESEKAYNDADLDKYLIGVKQINIVKKSALPNIVALRIFNEEMKRRERMFNSKAAPLNRDLMGDKTADSNKHDEIDEDDLDEE